MNRWLSLLKVQPGEGQMVALLFLHSFLLGAASNFVQTAAFALFLVEFDAQTLPWVYVTNALAVPLITFLYLRLGNRLRFSGLLLANLSFLVFLVSAFRLGLALGGARWLVFALPVLFQILAIFGNLEFWTLANRLYTVRQGKRLFGLVGAGFWMAVLITGLLIPRLVAWIGTANLLLLSAASLAGAVGLLLRITRIFADRLAAPDAATVREPRASLRQLLKSRYLILIIALVVLWWIAFFFLDNIFYDRAAVQYPGEEQLASFLGTYLAFLGVLALLSNAFLVGPVISRYGVRIGLLILPVMLAISTGGMTVVTAIAGAAALLFWLTVSAKLLNLALGFSVDRTALTILYQPLPADRRGQAQTMAEGVFQPLANGLAGLGLLALNATFAGDIGPLIYGLFFVVLVWLVVAVRIARRYPAMLLRALRKRQLDGAALPLADRSSLAILEQGLQSPHPDVVIYALKTLEAAEHDTLPAALATLFTHPTPAVRRHVLQRIEHLGVTSALPAVSQRVTAEPSPTVRGAAVRTLAALGEGQVLEQVFACLDDPSPEVQRGAMVGMLRSGESEGALLADHSLRRLVDSPEPAKRVLAAQVIGEVGSDSYYQPLVSLLQDPDRAVQRAALVAAGQIRHPQLWASVLEKLGSPALRKVAATALVSGGEAVLPLLGAASSSRDQILEVQVELVRIHGRLGGAAATTWLRSQVAHRHRSIRTAVLQALDRCGYRAGPDQAPEIEDRIRAEAAHSAETLALLHDIGEDDAVNLLRAVLEEELRGERARLILLMSLLYDRQAILRARDTLRLDSEEKKAYALEVIDVLMPQAPKRFVLPLLTDMPPGQKLEQLQASIPQPRMDRQERLVQIVASPAGDRGAWTVACALYAIGRLPARDLGEATVAALSAPSDLIREAAVCALSRLDGERYGPHLEAMKRDANPQVAACAQRALRAGVAGALATDARQEEMMLTTIERVLVLKRVAVFAETPDEALAAVADVLEEIRFGAGETIFNKGDLGDCLYIIVDGRVRVHDGAHTIEHLATGEVFGEMALLDPAPRMASVTAIEDTHLLRLAQEPLYELMDDRTDVARGMIRVLCRRLREQAIGLDELGAGLEAGEGQR